MAAKFYQKYFLFSTVNDVQSEKKVANQAVRRRMLICADLILYTFLIRKYVGIPYTINGYRKYNNSVTD